MKRTLYMVLLVALLGVTGCAKKNIIPDNTLADIFHDAFIVNSYIGEERINLDSLHVYEPIFQRYGYTAADVVHTVGNFSRRKSVRLGSIVEAAIAKLEKDLAYYEGFLASVMKKLSNERFVSSAPAQVVANERAKQSDAEAKIAAIQAQLAALK